MTAGEGVPSISVPIFPRQLLQVFDELKRVGIPASMYRPDGAGGTQVIALYPDNTRLDSIEGLETFIAWVGNSGDGMRPDDGPVWSVHRFNRSGEYLDSYDLDIADDTDVDEIVSAIVAIDRRHDG